MQTSLVCIINRAILHCNSVLNMVTVYFFFLHTKPQMQCNVLCFSMLFLAHSYLAKNAQFVGLLAQPLFSEPKMMQISFLAYEKNILR